MTTHAKDAIVPAIPTYRFIIFNLSLSSKVRFLFTSIKDIGTIVIAKKQHDVVSAAVEAKKHAAATVTTTIQVSAPKSILHLNLLSDSLSAISRSYLS
jgi:hypothetical protein